MITTTMVPTWPMRWAESGWVASLGHEQLAEADMEGGMKVGSEEGRKRRRKVNRKIRRQVRKKVRRKAGRQDDGRGGR